MEDYSDFSPAAIPSNEVRRLEAVRKTGVMDVANEELFLIYTELAKSLSSLPASQFAKQKLQKNSKEKIKV